MTAPTTSFDVAIVGGGPAGLTLAIELGRHGVSCLVLDAKPATTTHPQANATQARTMEHFRRLGFADEIRAMGLPRDYPTDVVYFTRFSGHELARLRLPSAAAAAELARRSTGSWSTPELPHRCSQLFIEPVLRRHAESCSGVTVRFGWLATGFEQDGEGVTLHARPVGDGPPETVRARYLVGCDGARSMVRRQLGIDMAGESRIVREFMGGKVHATYFRAPGLYERIRGDRAWMYFAFNPDRRSVLMAIDGSGTFVFHAQLKPGEEQDDIPDARAHAMFEQALGMPCPTEKISASTWHAGHVLVAQRYSDGRVFLAGDAAHLFTPTGGLGYNTAIDDVANLGWKLAALVRGWGGSALAASYHAERHPVGLRNTAMARGFADHIGHFKPDAQLEAAGAPGDESRRRAGAFLSGHLRQEFNIPGITFGVRYDGSPIVVGDGSRPPAEAINTYEPTACPGGRAPHWWLPDGSSLYDRLGPAFTLLAMTDDPAALQLEHAAAGLGIPLAVLRLPHAPLRAMYEADFALVRPDQHVAWRGSSAAAAFAALARAAGHGAP